MLHDIRLLIRRRIKKLHIMLNNIDIEKLIARHQCIINSIWSKIDKFIIEDFSEDCFLLFTDKKWFQEY